MITIRPGDQTAVLDFVLLNFTDAEKPFMSTSSRTWTKWCIWSHQRIEVRLQTEIWQATAQIEEDKTLIEQQARLLHRLNETKSRFFADISHEFRRGAGFFPANYSG